ncbi:MAG: hypothetical protein H0W07_01340 [Chloroflexi bacterium]|nr:hypothetical protein [Chloroflexota bacterium]
MLGGLLRLLVFRMLPRRILPALLLYDVFRMFRKRAGGRGRGGYGNFENGSGTGSPRAGGRSSGGGW